MVVNSWMVVNRVDPTNPTASAPTAVPLPTYNQHHKYITAGTDTKISRRLHTVQRPWTRARPKFAHS